jgi:hypothetical protein
MAARDLLVSTRRTLQLVDEEIDKVKTGRLAVETASDVSTEHRVAWFGATDDNDRLNGIQVAGGPIAGTGPAQHRGGFENPYRGTIRMQEDAAFVCTRVLVAVRVNAVFEATNTFSEFPQGRSDRPNNLLVRMLDGNTGRNLTPGISTGPFDRDRGAVPLSFLSSIRFGLGSNFKNSIFSEFTLPRASTVRVEVFNMDEPFDQIQIPRLYLSLYGYKVYGA